ncbi:class I SAM-dependent methyltransferase [Desulfovibrio sp. JY]|nr:class I SAM-dependent methyltransferase [Desulfovibrio sp. JY]
MNFMRWLKEKRIGQCRRPSGLLGEYVGRRMNRYHYPLTSWGLDHVLIGKDNFILDVGCGGGRTVGRLAKVASDGLVVGIDVSDKSLDLSRRVNRKAMRHGHVAIRKASVMELPFPADTFHLATAVETHYFWPDITKGMAEILRVLRPGGSFLLIAEIYRCDRYDARNRKWLELTPMAYLDTTEFHDCLAAAGFDGIGVYEHTEEGWVCCVGRKKGPPAAGGNFF